VSVEFNLLRSTLMLRRWRTYIPEQATKHKFLMHGILALSALHVAYKQPDQGAKYITLCDKHQNTALESYRGSLTSTIDASTADALFAFASMISVTSMARSCSPAVMRDAGMVDLDAVCELFFLTRGVRDVIHLNHVVISQGPMAEMFHGHIISEGTVVVSEAETSPTTVFR